MKLLALLFSLVAMPLASASERITSFYSTTDEKFIATLASSEFEAEPGIDHFHAVCPGYGGYELICEGGDIRSWINVRYGDQTSDLGAETMQRSRGEFPNLANTVVEWRGVIKDRRFHPFAIIFRMTANDPEAPDKERSTLIVVALKKGHSEVIGTAHGADEDAKAKKIAEAWWASNH